MVRMVEYLDPRLRLRRQRRSSVSGHLLCAAHAVDHPRRQSAKERCRPLAVDCSQCDFLCGITVPTGARRNPMAVRDRGRHDRMGCIGPSFGDFVAVVVPAYVSVDCIPTQSWNQVISLTSAIYPKRTSALHHLVANPDARQLVGLREHARPGVIANEQIFRRKPPDLDPRPSP